MEGMESLGHWERGSSMPALYDAQSGVTELSARSTIVSALAKGWSPANNGEIAAKYSVESVVESSASKYKISNLATDLCKSRKRKTDVPVLGLLVVAHTKRKRIHYVSESSTHTLCRWWECGSSDAPGKFAVFGELSDFLVEYSWCRHCLRQYWYVWFGITPHPLGALGAAWSSAFAVFVQAPAHSNVVLVLLSLGLVRPRRIVLEH